MSVTTRGAQAAPASSVHGASARILLVDDNPDSLLVLESLLEGIEVTPVRAHSGQEALRRLFDAEFALLILDVRMPDIDGFELARLVRQQRRHRDLPIIFVTALERTREDVEHAYALGAVDFMSKPVGPEAFRSKVRTFVELWLSRRDLERQVAERTMEIETAAAEHRASEARLRLLVEQAPGVQWTTDPSLRLTLTVGRGLSTMGLKSGELDGRSITDVVSPEDPAVEAHRQALAGKSTGFEGIYFGRDLECSVAPLRDGNGEVIGVIGVGFDRTERSEGEQTIRLVSDIGRKLASELDLEKLVQATTDLATRLTGAQIGAFFYNVTDEKGESYRLYSLSGISRDAFSRIPNPRNTAIFEATFRGEGVLRSDDIRKDPRYGKNSPHHGIPEGHFPVVSYLAVPVVSRSGEVLGGLLFGHGEPGRFTESHERLVLGIAAYAGVAIENARLYRRAQESERSERERARELEVLMGSVPAAILITKDDGQNIVGNQMAHEVLGMPQGVNLSKSPPQGAPPVPYDVLEDGRPIEPSELPVQKAAASGKPVLGRELEIRRGDGSRRVIYGNTIPILSETGAVKQVVSAFADITERKQAEAALRMLADDRAREVEDLTRLHEFSARLSGALDSGKILRELLEAVVELQGGTMGFLELFDPEKQALYVAVSLGHPEEAARRIGYIPIAEGQGACGTAGFRRRRVVVEDVETDPLCAPFRDFARWAGFRSVWSVPLLGRGGELLGVLSSHHGVPRRPTSREIHLVELYAHQAAAVLENARLFARIQQELAERRRAEEAKGRLAAIVESSDDAIVSENLDGRVTSWNGGAERLFGYAAAEMIGQSIRQLVPEDLLPEEADILAKINRGECIDHYETRRCRKDGGIVDVSLTISPMRDAQGAVIGASKIARDISEQVRNREEVQRVNAMLEDRVRERTRSLEDTIQELDSFAYTVAHDLRAPLRAVHSFGQILLEDAATKLDDAEKRYLEEMIRAGARMDTLIADLLAYSRISRQETLLEPVDLGIVIDKVLGEMWSELAERKAKIRVERPFPLVSAHAIMLGQALTNLISNATKFVSPGTEPRVTLRAETRESGRIRLWVEDNGIGIASEHHPKLFKVFERLHGRDAYPGTGIGLAIVRRALERMRGSVGVESEAGHGSRFWIELRACRDAPIP